MSPKPYVRGQAGVLAMFLVAAAVVGSAVAALACSVVCALFAWRLHARYRGDVLVAGVDVPQHRERLDLVVAGDARAALATGLTASVLLIAYGVQPPDVGLARETPVLLAVAAAAVYLSSLVDWYVILPRISGLLGARPCRPASGEPQRFPDTWRETTRWWYIHRITAALFMRFALAYAIVLSIHRHVSLPGGASVVGSAVMGGFAAYVAAAFRAFPQAGHPTLIVGQTVRRRNVKHKRRTVRALGRTIRIPLLKRRVAGSRQPREYVYDVALEGVQLVPVAPRERRIPRDRDGAIAYERAPAKVELRDVSACAPEPADPPFSGCEEGCSGINWYCIENPRCFNPK